MSIVPKTNIFNVKIDPYLDRYDAACHDISLAIFERALKNSNLHLYPPPSSILLKTVGLLLTDLVIRVVRIISYLLRGLFYLAQLQRDKTKYYFYSALIWGPLTLFTKTASNCSRLFGCIVGFAKPSAAISIWLTAEIIDAFILRKKIAYTPCIVTETIAQPNIQGSAFFYFGNEKVQTLYKNEQEKLSDTQQQNIALDRQVTRARSLMEKLNLRDSPKLEAEIQFLIRFHMSHFLTHLFDKYDYRICNILSSVPPESRLGLDLKFIDYYMNDFRDLPKMMQKKRKVEGAEYYLMTINGITRLHFYLKKQLEGTKQYFLVEHNDHQLKLESLIFVQDTLFPNSLLG